MLVGLNHRGQRLMCVLKIRATISVCGDAIGLSRLDLSNSTSYSGHNSVGLLLPYPSTLGLSGAMTIGDSDQITVNEGTLRFNGGFDVYSVGLASIGRRFSFEIVMDLKISKYSKYRCVWK